MSMSMVGRKKESLLDLPLIQNKYNALSISITINSIKGDGTLICKLTMSLRKLFFLSTINYKAP